MNRKSRSAAPKSLRRRVAVRTPLKTIAVFCEGQKSEPQYIEALARQEEVRDAAAVDIQLINLGSGSVPVTLVDKAVKAKRRNRIEGTEIDEFWCVFDVEWPINHPNLGQALDKAKSNGIHIAVSNPCFELWLIIHFQSYTAWLNNSQAISKRRSLDKSTGKNLDPSIYMPLRKDAFNRAKLLETQHQNNSTAFPDDNPSSGMHLLLASVNGN